MSQRFEKLFGQLYKMSEEDHQCLQKADKDRSLFTLSYSLTIFDVKR
jgi:hypothetical protein